MVILPHTVTPSLNETSIKLKKGVFKKWTKTELVHISFTLKVLCILFMS